MQPEKIQVYVCPACGWWQKWPGQCENLCPVQAEEVTYAICRDEK